MPLRVDDSGTVRVGDTRVTLDILIGAFKLGANCRTDCRAVSLPFISATSTRCSDTIFADRMRWTSTCASVQQMLRDSGARSSVDFHRTGYRAATAEAARKQGLTSSWSVSLPTRMLTSTLSADCWTADHNNQT